MALLNFPNTPTIGDVYVFSGRAWGWNGVGWFLTTPPLAGIDGGVPGSWYSGLVDGVPIITGGTP